MFFTRLISGIILVLAAIFFFVQGGYFLLFALAVLSLLGLYELLRVLQMEKSSLAVVTYVATAVYYGMLCIYGGIDWLLLGLLIFMMLALLVIYVFSYPKLRIVCFFVCKCFVQLYCKNERFSCRKLVSMANYNFCLGL